MMVGGWFKEMTALGCFHPTTWKYIKCQCQVEQNLAFQIKVFCFCEYVCIWLFMSLKFQFVFFVSTDKESPRAKKIRDSHGNQESKQNGGRKKTHDHSDLDELKRLREEAEDKINALRYIS
jgi:hypothetical protein